MKKRLFSILMVVSLIFIFVACSNNAEQESATDEPTTAVITEVPTTLEPTTEEPTEPAADLIEEMLAEMTVEEKVGQMFFARCPDSDAAQTASDYHLGGYILFGRDFEGKTEDEVIADIESYQSASKIPMLIGVDEEGGTVVRASYYLLDNAYLSPKDNYYSGGWNAVETTENEKADFLLSLGINVNLAPVCDVTTNEDSFMYLRSFSGDAVEVCGYVTKTIEIYKNKGLGSTLKHFPGYGDNVDTHTGIAYDNREYSQFANIDFKPFEAGISAGADCVLVAHNIVECMDSDYPASLSDKVHQILRYDLVFNGVIMTDDLIMDAITQYTGTEAAAVTAAKAGNDMLCCSDIEGQYPAVLEAVQSGEIPIAQIDQSVKRILRWKQNLGLL